MFEAAVAMSRKWDAYEAGKEIGEQIRSKIDNKPTFVLLYSTIHLNKHGGFQRLLDAVYKNLPKDVPLLGGSISGFICQEGCFTRGVVALAVYDEKIAAEAFYCVGARKNPERVGKTCAEKANKDRESNKYPNKFTMDILPGPIMPSIPGTKIKMVVTENNIISGLAPMALEFSTLSLNKGMGREKEVLDSFAKKRPEGDVVGGSSTDDNKYSSDFQFYRNKVLENSLVILNCSTEYDVLVEYTSAVPAPSEWHAVTKSSALDYVVEEIDGKPALEVYTKSYHNLTPDLIFKEPNQVHRRFMFCPAVTMDAEGVHNARIPGTFYGHTIGIGHPVYEKKIGFSSTNGRLMLGTIDEVFGKVDASQLKICIMYGCAVMQEALGVKVYNYKEKIDEYLGKTPYLLLFSGGENYRTKKSAKNSLIHLAEMSLTALCLSEG